ncbi:piRNA biogenesis protein EXD1 isoform X1 [Mixophyes fleayi]|uniref:piRNA biogenesis protein EXD1 isoform X1 n=1 Tax=Mixophyes fleayi TaxID=3061075 RepID=UPI003F4E2030
MDIVTDKRFISRIIGKTIKITTTYGFFKGLLLSINADCSFLLVKVKDLRTGIALPGAKSFYGHSIIKVEVQEESSHLFNQNPERHTVEERINILSQERIKHFGKQAVKPKVTDTVDHQGMHAGILHVIKSAVPDRYIPRHPHQDSFQCSHLPVIHVSPSVSPFILSHFKDIPSWTDFIPCTVDDEDVNYSVIDQFQSLFGLSMQHLQRQKVLSLTAVGQSLSRYGKLCWIQVATNSCVYLFDILILGPRVFKNGLQMILEDKGILKVVHDCRWLADLLSHQYGVILSNVFDTQVADVYLFSMETGGFLPHRTCTLKECVTRYLNVTPSRVSILTYKQILEKDNPNVWFVRPMPIPLFKVVALETIYLLPMRLVMLDAIFADFTFLVDEYLDTYRKRRADDLGSLEIASSELPKELQQLPVLQQLRREKALQEFHFTSQGFLSREKIKKAK